MSVIISNLSGGHHDDPNRYEVCINYDRIALFDHTPSDGLAECLRQAAEAVDRTALQERGERVKGKSNNEGINMQYENDNEADLLMGVEPIAKYLGVTRRQAYRLVYDKIMPSFKLGGTVAAR